MMQHPESSPILTPTGLLEWSQVACKELLELREKVDSLIQRSDRVVFSFLLTQTLSHHQAFDSVPMNPPTMSLFSSSLQIPPHYPPHLFSQSTAHATSLHLPDSSQDIEVTQTNDRTLRMKPKTTNFVEDSALLLSLHHQVSSSSHLERIDGDEMSLRDLPSGLIRQGLDGTVNITESAREWKDK
jgi:hypothetical protein